MKSSHAWHCVNGCAEDVPAAQNVHRLPAVAEILLTSHHLQSRNEFVSSCPEGQFTHGACPALDFLPAVHAPHAAPEIEVWPAEHGEHAPPGLELLPAGQLPHAPPALEDCPAGQLPHAPQDSEVCPALQLTQAAEPSAERWFALQAVQDISPPVEYEFSPHVSHPLLAEFS